jgi:N-acetylglucosamine transport system permease protein
MSLYMYETAFKSSNFGYASAIGVTLLVITLVLTTITLRITRREV